MRTMIFCAGLLAATQAQAVTTQFDGVLTDRIDGAFFGFEEDEVDLEFNFRFSSIGRENAWGTLLSIGGQSVDIMRDSVVDGAAWIDNNSFRFFYNITASPEGSLSAGFELINGYYPVSASISFLGENMFPDDTDLIAENFFENADGFSYVISFIKSSTIFPPEGPEDVFLSDVISLRGSSYESFSIGPAVNGFLNFGRGTSDYSMDLRVYPDSPAGPVPVVPLPAGGVLLLTGLGALASGNLLRRRRG